MKIFFSGQLFNPLTLLLFLVYPSCNSLNTITPNHPIKDGDVLVSNKATFALGFFSPGNSRNRYVGIWYNNDSKQTVVWVANRDTPLTNTYGILSINGHGNLVILDSQTQNPKLIWSVNVLVPVFSPITSARLLDNGNFILVHNESQKVLWQSFDYPSNTMLPYMKLGLDRKTGLNRFLTSWKSPNDPGTGNFTCGIDPSGFPQFFLYKNGAPLWRHGSWTGKRWSGVPEMTTNFILNASFVNNANEVSIMYGVKDPTILSRFVVIDDIGYARSFMWDAREHRWFQFWYDPGEDCDNFNRCGPNGICDPYNVDKFECKCLPGFEPKYPQEWYLGDGSGGCVRNPNVSTCQSGEGFVLVVPVKTPDTSKARVDASLNLKEREEKCLKDCSCVAYTTANESIGSGCLSWHGDMLDIRTYTHVGQDLFVRVDARLLAKYAKKSQGSLGKKRMIAIIVLSAFLVLLFMVYILYCWFVKKQKRARRKHSKYQSTIDLQDSPSIRDLESRQDLDLPFFDLSDIAEATNNFSPDNMLGQGGFGSVYKGLFSNGMAIAVKRLSIFSGQGIKEFKSEVALIAKLQHRNLVRILGYCIEGEEKMLIYEYLPNKSLDYYIFDESKSSQLDWKKRLDIISGIARGILYLHQDSILRVIHRDLKASNILLDSSFNPKIADFGMARIFGRNQIEANTNCVVGTYGYMSPEYAMEGIFSIKSDVYSFGVLIMEIITGRKNSGHYNDITSSTLVGHIWDLWREGRAMEIIDSTLADTYLDHEVLRCIQIGLLCVQDYPKERPTMSVVISMLDNDTMLPTPKQPVFIFKRLIHYNGINSVNGLSITRMEGR
ncbi:hypothetical protein L6164_005625 [Bauhinia variegata]|uniref:Uncharacterized protein n=1 Tax=Bauhinia variegata TaxID=167791 RepID=A0ACB9PTB8_BAUVA|nr:hypothetical protein L6164_005625 [Bauhinia variegata]